jgi:hypothetical protein
MQQVKRTNRLPMPVLLCEWNLGKSACGLQCMHDRSRITFMLPPPWPSTNQTTSFVKFKINTQLSLPLDVDTSPSDALFSKQASKAIYWTHRENKEEKMIMGYV